jgi:hypothetical protein
MNIHEDERYGMIRLFETHIHALSLLVEQDSSLFSWRRNRMAVCHRLARHLEQGLHDSFNLQQRNRYFVDLCAPIMEDAHAMIPDIVVHDRDQQEPQRLMAIVCREGYLSEQELLDLHELKTKGNCELTLGMAFLPNKEYILIYRADETTIDYYHFFRTEKHCQLFKRRQISEVSADRSQLKLDIKSRKRSYPHQ